MIGKNENNNNFIKDLFKTILCFKKNGIIKIDEIINLIKVNVYGGISFKPILVNAGDGAPIIIPKNNTSNALVLLLINCFF